MALTVNTNIASLNAQRNLSSSQRLFQTSMQRLSSGLRINSAKDDAAGLAISDRMTSQIRGLNQATRNANDGISLSQTAEGALQETTNMLQRMREIAVQSANDTNSDTDRDSLDAEYQALVSEIDRIATATTFNGTSILDGTGGTLTFHVGANFNLATPQTTTTTTVGTGTTAVTTTTVTPASAGDQVISVNLANINASQASLFAGAAVAAGDAGDVQDQTNANQAIQDIDEAIQLVDTARGSLGAVQSRFESTIANLQNIAENLSASRSRIMDADIAMETANMTKANILQQAGVAILAQANQSTQLALGLLG